LMIKSERRAVSEPNFPPSLVPTLCVGTQPGRSASAGFDNFFKVVKYLRSPRSLREIKSSPQKVSRKAR
jgi:hypothetical protein